MERRIRLANSTPDVKTLLRNSLQYAYSVAEATETDDVTSRFNGVSLQSQGEYNPPPPVFPVSVFSSLPCPLMSLQARTGLINAPRQDDEAIKRGSDSLLESKIREYARQKQGASRAHSLDLSLVLARIVEGSPDDPHATEPQDDVSDGENESPSSIGGSHVVGGTSSYHSPRRESANGAIGTPVHGMVAGSRMSAPVLPYLGSRPHAMRVNSGLAEDVIRGMHGNNR